MRLWQMIHDHGFVLFGNPSEEEIRQARSVREAVLAAVRFDVTNVSTYLDAFPEGKGWGWDDTPSVMLPFPMMWLEWKDGSEAMGMLLMSFAQDGAEIPQHALVFSFDPSNGRSRKELSTRPMLLGGFEFLADAVTGECIRSAITGSQHLSEMSDENRDALLDVVETKQPMAIATLGFLHCKNVSVENAPDQRTRQQRRFDERRGIDPVVFKTLVIDPSIGRKATAAERRDNHDPVTRLHICRGHFATYTAEKPLFGKYSGTFWIPAHVRGSAEVGEVRKDYRVKAGVAA